MSSPSSVLVTGANRGIGLELVRQLAALASPPSVIFATYRDEEKAKDLLKLAADTKTSTIRPWKIDVTDVAAYPELVAGVSSVVGDRGLNLLLNNAGIAKRTARIEDEDRKDLLHTYEVNTVVPILLTKAFLPLLLSAAESGSGSPFTWSRSAIVNVTSSIGSISEASSAGFYAYRMSKAALNMATKVMSVEFKTRGILAVGIHPGWVITDMGGPSAKLTTQQSVQAMLDTMGKLTEASNGGYLNFDGKPLAI